MRLQRWLAPQSNGQNITVLYTSLDGVYSGCGKNLCLSMCMYISKDIVTYALSQGRQLMSMYPNNGSCRRFRVCRHCCLLELMEFM
jgi:hypothetical protein